MTMESAEYLQFVIDEIVLKMFVNSPAVSSKD